MDDLREQQLRGHVLVADWTRWIAPRGGLGRLAGRLEERLFRHLEVDPGWETMARDAHGRGAVVYVLRSASLLDYAALDHLTRRFGLAPLGFVNDLPGASLPRDPTADLEAALGRGESAVLFLKRPPRGARRAPAGRDGEPLLQALLAAAEAGREVMCLPTLFLWTRHAERRGASVIDAVLGPRDQPTDLRRLGQYLLHYKRCEVRAGEAQSLSAFIAQADDDDPNVLPRRLTYALLRKVERERRAVVGPAHKPPDRVVEEVVRSPKIRKLVADMAGPRPEDQAELTEQAREMLREMQFTPEPATQEAVATLAERLIERIYAGVDVDEAGIEQIRELTGRGTVVLLPSHKSHVDYIVLSYVLHRRSLPLPVIAAGDNLAFFPAGPILRRCGAFYIRRSFRGDKLYTAIVDAYVRRLLRDGWMLEFFLEGGRSRTGKLLPPMLGLLNMVVSSALALPQREVFFVPVSIGYERLVEEGAFARELSGGKKRKEDAWQLLEASSVLQSRWGRIDIQFADAINLRELRESMGLGGDSLRPAKRRSVVKRLALQVMSAINHVTAVTPGALVALILLSHGRRGIAYRDVLTHARGLLAIMLELGARPSASLVTDGDLDEGAVRELLDLFVGGGLIKQHVPGDTLTADEQRRAALYVGTDVIFTVPDDKRLRLDFAKNHIIHWLVDRAIVATALFADGDRRLVARSVLGERVQSLSRLFKLEFTFRSDAPFDTILDELIDGMHREGTLRREGGEIALAPDAIDRQTLYAGILRTFLDGYRVAARGLSALNKGPLARKELLRRNLRLGERMFLEGVIERSEAVSQPLLDNALSTFVDLGFLRRQGDELALAETFSTPGALATVEGRITAFLPFG